MTKSCAVPKCRTGYKSNKEKHSVFGVPKDAVRLEKWEEAIPGNIKLRAKDVICDKHFEERFILREWIVYDPNDESKIFARAPYKYPRLSESAVPTRFDENLEDEKAVASIMELDAPGCSSSIESTCIKTVWTPLNGLVQSSVLDNTGSIAPFRDRPSVVDDSSTNASCDDAQMSLTMKLKVEQSEDSEHLVVKCDSPAEQSPDANDFSNYEFLTFTKSEVDSSMEMYHDNLPIESSSTTLNIDAKPYSVVSTVTISEKIQPANSTTVKKYSTDIPNCWSVTELCVEKEQRIVFQYIVMKADKGVKIPVLQKCVALHSDRQLEYFVYGRLVEIQGTMLNRTLEEASSLKKTLQMFQYMGICVGLGVISKDIAIEDAYIDPVQQWRHDNCTLISKWKRCANCTKLRNHVNSRLRNMKTRPTLKRIHRKASKVFDNRKVVTLLKRNAEERRSRKKAERHANSLRKELEGVREKIAYIKESTLN